VKPGEKQGEVESWPDLWAAPRAAAFLSFQAQYSNDLHRFLMAAADAFISLSQPDSSLV
jgi:hypothetical protein